MKKKKIIEQDHLSLNKNKNKNIYINIYIYIYINLYNVRKKKW